MNCNKINNLFQYLLISSSVFQYNPINNKKNVLLCILIMLCQINIPKQKFWMNNHVPSICVHIVFKLFRNKL